MTARSGLGFDIHPLVEGRPLVLAGVTVPSDMGPSGHSDGDPLTHAVIDAILGGAGLGDIGAHFPSTDNAYRDAAGPDLMREAVSLVTTAGWQVSYVDATIMAERPALSPFIQQVGRSLAASMNVRADQVNLKAKTTDGLGAIGRGEGIAAMAIATVEPVQ